ncbi:MAG: amino acid ABC transporter, partial [Methylobacteriaceae bacterium]|nr:amino acid ABC transporter [Methylobacteriaceae bacterium]
MREKMLLTVVAVALAAAIGPASAKEWKTVRFGMDASYAPFESVDTKGDIIGF